MADPDLADLISECLEESKFDGPPRLFVPSGTVERLVTRDVAAKELKLNPHATNGSDDEKLLKFTMEHAKMLLAISVHIGMNGTKLREAMRLFWKNEFKDSNLPIEFDSSSKAVNKLESFDQTKKLWTSSKVHQFCREAQWKFLVVVFNPENFIYELSPYSILPFVEKAKEFKRGAFAIVYKAKIHKDHCDTSKMPPGTSPPEYFAIKESEPADESEKKEIPENWQREAKALQQMGELKNPHIVKFIAAFRRGKTPESSHYLMFEWADRGCLIDLWQALERPDLTSERIKGTVYQLLGLSAALYNAHNLDRGGGSTRHGDLHPGNILWFSGGKEEPYGVLKIGDWGLAKHHNLPTKNRTKQTTTMHGTVRYQGPEVNLNQAKYSGPLSRLYDIWSMGVVVLEYMVWLMYGLDGLKAWDLSLKEDTTNDDRPCYQVSVVDGKSKPMVHDVVVKWINHMARDPVCSSNTALGDLLRIVRNRLLVVDLPPDKGDMSPEEANEEEKRIPFRPHRWSGNSSDSRDHRPTLKVNLTGPDDKSAIMIDTPPLLQPSPQSPPPPNLVVPAMPNLDPGSGRAKAVEFRNLLENIMRMDSDEKEAYWYVADPKGKARYGPPDFFRLHGKRNSTDFLTVASAGQTADKRQREKTQRPQASEALTELAINEQQTVRAKEKKSVK